MGGEPVQPGPEEALGPETTDPELRDRGDARETDPTTNDDGTSAGEEDTEIGGVPQ